jgi:cytochrome b involved in lipid metabolism
MNKQLIAVITLVAVATAGLFAWIMLSRDDGNTTTSESQTTPSQQSSADEIQTQESTAETSELARFTKEDVAMHSTEKDCWTIISGKVYDLTSYIPRHPGGDDILLACGTDGTSLFTERKTSEGEEVGSGTPHTSSANSQLKSFLLGDLSSTATE